MLQLAETDMMIFYRALARIDARDDTDDPLQLLLDAYYVPEQLTPEVSARVNRWLGDYRSRLRSDRMDQEARREAMNAVNPKYVLRNYMAQVAIDEAEQGDHSLVNELLDLLRRPYDRFLRERIPVYGVAEHLRQSGARDEVILAFPPGALLSYIRMNRVVGDYFGLMGYRRKFLTSSLCQERFVEQLQLDGVSLFVVSQKFLNRSPAWNNYSTSRLTSEYADRYATVFRIGSGTESPSASPHQGSRTPLREQARGSRAFTGEGDNPRVIPYFPVASDGFLQGFARIVNHSDEAGTVVIHGIDDTGTRYGPITLALGARETRHFNSDDLVACIVTERASGSSGDVEAGSWRLLLATDLDIEALAYIRTEDGFVSKRSPSGTCNASTRQRGRHPPKACADTSAGRATL